MSHFSVLVVTDHRPSEAELEGIMAPWHEFECTGEDNMYVIDKDITEEARANFEKDTENRLRGPDGTLYSPYEDMFYREPTEEEKDSVGSMFGSGYSNGISYTSKDWGDGLGYRPKVRFVPDGWEEVEIPASEVQSFAEFADGYYGAPPVQFGETPDYEDAHKYGYALLDENGEAYKIVDRTNPNAKWDWWQVGGRWSGILTPNYDPGQDPKNQEVCWLCQGTGNRNDAIGLAARLEDPSYTCNGCQGKGVSQKWPTSWAKHSGDQIQRKDLPLEQLRTEKEIAAAKDYDKFHTIVGGREFPLWSDVLKDYEGRWDEGREFYNNHPVIKAINESRDFIWATKDDYAVTREEFIQAARDSALSSYAMVKDGEWFEKGQMGWFGVSMDEDDNWYSFVNETVEKLDGETWLTVIDCHI